MVRVVPAGPPPPMYAPVYPGMLMVLFVLSS